MPTTVEALFQEVVQHGIDCIGSIRIADDIPNRRIGYLCEHCGWNRGMSLVALSQTPDRHKYQAFFLNYQTRNETLQLLLDGGMTALFPSAPTPPEPVIEGLPRYEREELL